jgi:hypothetical protein
MLQVEIVWQVDSKECWSFWAFDGCSYSWGTGLFVHIRMNLFVVNHSQVVALKFCQLAAHLPDSVTFMELTKHGVLFRFQNCHPLCWSLWKVRKKNTTGVVHLLMSIHPWRYCNFLIHMSTSVMLKVM